ncbi:solute carrier family 22 member 3-like [Bombyx mandarina]|uniref:Solute carrier family 22 member 3-like n=1 Tax=Bombyx mandarina TaxID=7092 RepID=A0A6J2KD25_BOMMA|nr:solute carrier family 22 member 3-like [Bombyx mandarina]
MEQIKYTELDDVLSKFSIFGRYHIELLLYLAFAYASNSMYCSNYIFAAEKIEYRCTDPLYNSSSERNTSRCLEWSYEDPHSFVAEFQIGDQEWKRTLVGTAHSFGYMIGLLLIGPISDRLGRKKAIVITGVLGGVFGLTKSFTSWYWVYIALEFLESALGDICSPLYILNIEIVSTKRRVSYYLLCSLGYILGSIILPLTAWAVPYWRNYLRAIYTPAFLFFFYTYLIDESPRWLLIKGKKDKAITILKNAAIKNKIEFGKGVLEDLHTEDQKGIGFFNLLRLTFTSPTMLRRCVICIIWWGTCTFVNYGLIINSVSLEGNKYVNFILMSVLDIPGNFVIMYILLYYKRKYPLIVTFLLGGVLCMVQPFLPTDLPWLSLIVYITGKLMSSFYFSITYMYTSELFPTYTRNSMHALCSSLGRIGSIIAPQTPLLMAYWRGLPSMIFGISAVLAGLVTFLVPDTADDSLPDTVRQAEDIGKTKNVKNIEFT